MVAPIDRCRATLTGRLSVRAGFFGTPVLQVEERLDFSAAFDFEHKVTRTEHRWRDARMCDVVPRVVIAPVDTLVERKGA